MDIHPLNTLRSSLKSTSSRLRVFAIGIVVVILVLQFLFVPSWLKGYWAPRWSVMRLLYQCLGSREDEQARWAPDVVLVSACERPVQTGISGDQTQVGVWARSKDQDWVVDAQTGDILLAIPHAHGGFDIFVNEKYVVRTERRGYEIVKMVFDIETGESTQAIDAGFRTPDMDLLRKLYAESNGNAVYVVGKFPALLFHTPMGLKVVSIGGLLEETQDEVADGFGLKATGRRPGFNIIKVTYGGSACLIGFETEPNPIVWHPSFCFLSVDEPILQGP